MSHFLSATDLTPERALHLFRLAAALKQGWKAGRRAAPLAARTIALIFEKPSLRTRVTLEVGIVQLGGRAVHLSGSEIGMGTRESVPDVARNLSRWVDGIVARLRPRHVETLARHATIPVINGLSDFEHPCQALADYFTLGARHRPRGRAPRLDRRRQQRVPFPHAAGRDSSAATLAVACPRGPRPRSPRRAARRRSWAAESPSPAIPWRLRRGADVLYTDVWISMGQEAEREERLETFSRYQLSEPLVAAAKPSALVMHCLPAHRGEEITDGVLDGPRSIVLDQAENRLHAQKAIVLQLLGGTMTMSDRSHGLTPRRLFSRTPGGSTPRSSCAGSSSDTGARWWPSARTSGRGRS